MRHLLRAIKRQRVECGIRYPRYLIGATSHGTRSLRRDPRAPLPLSDLIFLSEDDDIRAWLLANQQESKDPLDLLLLESRRDEGEDPEHTPEPEGGRYPFLDRDVWERAGEEDLFEEETGEEDASDDEDQDVDEDEEEEEPLEPSGDGAIIIDSDQNDGERTDTRISRTEILSPNPSDTSSGESWNPPPPSEPCLSTSSGRRLNLASLSAPGPSTPSTRRPLRQSTRTRPPAPLASPHNPTRQTRTNPATSTGGEPSHQERPRHSGERRPAVSDSGHSGPSSEEKEIQARAILEQRPWLASYLGALSRTSGVDTPSVSHGHRHDGTVDSSAVAATERGVVRLAGSTPAAPDTFTPSLPTPSALDPVLGSPRSLPTLSTIVPPPTATPSAPNVPSPGSTSKGTKRQGTRKKRRGGRR